MIQDGIDTRLVCGFLDAGKTTYIQDCIRNDFFHKYGSTLILCFEQGDTEYEEGTLKTFRTNVAYYDGGDITAFCRCCLEEYRPDRIYVEMNTMTERLRESFLAEMKVTYVCTWFDWRTLDINVTNLLSYVRQMVQDSHQVTFRGCPSKDLLAPYSQTFRAINHRAVYLRQDPMGYHEKAFDLFVPYSLDAVEFRISEQEYIPFWLDAMEHPEHYAGKRILFTSPVQLRSDTSEKHMQVGRIVMTCCMADLQFMGFDIQITNDTDTMTSGSWVRLEAEASVAVDAWQRRTLRLQADNMQSSRPPDEMLLKVSSK